MALEMFLSGFGDTKEKLSETSHLLKEIIKTVEDNLHRSKLSLSFFGGEERWGGIPGKCEGFNVGSVPTLGGIQGTRWSSVDQVTCRSLTYCIIVLAPKYLFLIIGKLFLSNQGGIII